MSTRTNRYLEMTNAELDERAELAFKILDFKHMLEIDRILLRRDGAGAAKASMNIWADIIGFAQKRHAESKRAWQKRKASTGAK